MGEHAFRVHSYNLSRLIRTTKLRLRAAHGFSAAQAIRAVLAFFASFFVVSAGLVVFLAAGDPLPPERKTQASRYAALDEDVDAVVADLEDRGGGSAR